MGSLFIEEDVVFVRHEEDIEKYIWQPLARVIGEWRMLANSPDKSKSKKAIEGYPVLLSEISRYKSSLEAAAEYNRGNDFQEYVAECLRQVDEQLVTNARIFGRVSNK